MIIYVTFVWLFALWSTNLPMMWWHCWGLISRVTSFPSTQCINWTSSHSIFTTNFLTQFFLCLPKAYPFIMSSIILQQFLLSFCSFALIDSYERFIQILFSLTLPIYAQINHQFDLFFTFCHSFIWLFRCICLCFFVALLFFSHILSFFLCLNYPRILL